MIIQHHLNSYLCALQQSSLVSIDKQNYFELDMLLFMIQFFLARIDVNSGEQPKGGGITLWSD